MPQELGPHTKIGKATFSHKLKRKIILLEEIRVRDLQEGLSSHDQERRPQVETRRVPEIKR